MGEWIGIAVRHDLDRWRVTLGLRRTHAKTDPVVRVKGRDKVGTKQQKTVPCRTSDGCGGRAPEQPL